MQILEHQVWTEREKYNHIANCTHFTGKHQNVKSTYMISQLDQEIRMWDLDTLGIRMLGFEATMET